MEQNKLDYFHPNELFVDSSWTKEEKDDYEKARRKEGKKQAKILNEILGCIE